MKEEWRKREKVSDMRSHEHCQQITGPLNFALDWHGFRFLNLPGAQDLVMSLLGNISQTFLLGILLLFLSISVVSLVVLHEVAVF